MFTTMPATLLTVPEVLAILGPYGDRAVAVYLEHVVATGDTTVCWNAHGLGDPTSERPGLTALRRLPVFRARGSQEAHHTRLAQIRLANVVEAQAKLRDAGQGAVTDVLAAPFRARTEPTASFEAFLEKRADELSAARLSFLRLLRVRVRSRKTTAAPFTTGPLTRTRSAALPTPTRRPGTTAPSFCWKACAHSTSGPSRPSCTAAYVRLVVLLALSGLSTAIG